MTDFSLPGEELLMAGRYAEAWPLFDQRRPRLDALPKMTGWPEWRGDWSAPLRAVRQLQAP